MNQDSTGKTISIGDKVKWRGQTYTIKSFGEDTLRGAVSIKFEETPYSTETPDEWAVDLIDD